MLGFLRELFKKIIEQGIKDQKNLHDLRRDLAMTLVELINILVESYGDFTSNSTKIGLGGFERFRDLNEHEKILERFSGMNGKYKEVEAYAKLRSMIVLWIIAP